MNKPKTSCRIRALHGSLLEILHHLHAARMSNSYTFSAHNQVKASTEEQPFFLQTEHLTTHINIKMITRSFFAICGHILGTISSYFLFYKGDSTVS